MATLANNGDGTFTLRLTATEIAAVQRANANPDTAINFEAKITAWIKSLADRHAEADAVELRRKYEAATTEVQAKVDALLEPVVEEAPVG